MDERERSRGRMRSSCAKIVKLKLSHAVVDSRAVGSPQEPVGSHYTAAVCGARLPNQLNTSGESYGCGDDGDGIREVQRIVQG
jgi:hypothetical protein